MCLLDWIGGSGVIEKTGNWLLFWTVKGIGLFLVCWGLGISKTLFIYRGNKPEGDGSPMDAIEPGLNVVYLDRQVRRAI